MSGSGEHVKRVFDEQVAAKARRRRALALRPVEEKLKVLIRLQEVAAAIAQATRGTSRKPWTLR